MKLSELKTGDKAKIENILEKKEIKIKLISMGVSENTEVIMVKNDCKGAVILAISNNRVILGRDLADKIQIKKI